MASRINTILIIGGTAGIGEAFVRRFHSLGKKVIVTGRSQAKLQALKKDLDGITTLQFDITDLAALPTHVTSILKDFPDLDSVVINSGIQRSFNLFEPSSITPEDIRGEIDTNLTAPTLLARLFAPHLLALALKGTKTTLFLTSSSIAYVPLAFYPTYCSTKAGIHALTLIIRQQLAFAGEEAKKNMNVVEIVPPYVDTGLDAAHREATIAMQGGPEKAFPAMPLQEYVDKFFAALEQVESDGSLKKEIGVGFGEMVAETWRGSFGKVYEQMGLTT
ncbi:NAD(P)-binding protein [Melanomma pulvis-pyrius CBS 109.77]|uniref:NAD(P)-binding protein n=1 Tax=Melanomma pulvis-pyrius CBS 109.77 TaxID=1314802 RepID=A0A6A6XRT8_9PLEO|nr:NAD(P)-binding protein [Melanomma pulvis-pyrius CBS 109.77]